MPRQLSIHVLLLCLACWSSAAQALDAASPVVRSEAQLQAALAGEAPTPLDALTPYGKRQFLRSLKWGERGLGSLGTAMLVRELDPQQIAALLAWVDASAFLPAVVDRVAGPPLRMPPTADTEARLLQLERLFAGADAGQLQGRYGELLGHRMRSHYLNDLPLGDLLLYFDAAALATEDRYRSASSAQMQHLYTVVPATERHLWQVYEELKIRKVDTRRGIDATVLGFLLQARRFEHARAFVAGKPHLQSTLIPAVQDPLGPAFRGRSAYRYEAASNTLVREALPPRAGGELLMLVDGGCHFSANALAALQGDAALRSRLLASGLTLVTPPRSPIRFEAIAAWNKDNPALPIRIPYGAGEWQVADVEDTPRFFLLKNGKVAGQVSGWPEGGNKAALLSLLDGA